MRHPPEFLRPLWSTLADITSWFDWNALAAIGTVGALWFVVVQSTRAGRAERTKAIGILTFLIGLVEPIETVPIYEDTDDEELRHTPGFEIDLGLAIVRNAQVGLKSLTLFEACSVGLVEWTMALPLALKDIEEVLTNRSVRATSVNSSMRYIAEAAQHFRLERERLQYIFPVRVLRRAWWNFGVLLADRRLRKMRREAEPTLVMSSEPHDSESGSAKC